MARHIIVLANDRLRQKACEYIMQAKANARVEFKGPKRSTDANGAMWAMLSDLSRELRWYGQMLDSEEWKLVMLDALRRDHRDQMKLVPNTDGTGFVNISGASSSDLDREEMHDLLTIIRAFGDFHQVRWSEPKAKADPRPAPPIEVYGEEA